MTRFPFFALGLLLSAGCLKTSLWAPPQAPWATFEQADTLQLAFSARAGMEGTYRFKNGADQFGLLGVMKWSLEIQATDTLFHLSVFCGSTLHYMILEGRRKGDSLLFQGYWRKLTNTQTGLIRAWIPAESGGRDLLGNAPVLGPDSIQWQGVYGTGTELPTHSFSAAYSKPISPANELLIIGHRGGGRNQDQLPFPENSLGMFGYAERLGAQGVEMDVQFTKDQVPVIFHDENLSNRAIQQSGLQGSVGDYTFRQLQDLVRLPDGEPLPTLRQALDKVLYGTNLQFVWLDTKYNQSMEPVRSLQMEYLQRAQSMGRNLRIVIGVPDQAAYTNFMALPSFAQTPSLCELSTQVAEQMNAQIWAPRFTQGLVTEDVMLNHREGRKVYVWTLDEPDLMNQFLQEGNFDGILTNYAPLAAYLHYVQP